MPIPWQQRPFEVVEYLVDFGCRLAGDTIAGMPVVIADSGVVVGDIGVTASPATGTGLAAVRFTLTGGSAGTTATICCRVTTAAGQSLEAEPLLDLLGTSFSNTSAYPPQASTTVIDGGHI